MFQMCDGSKIINRDNVGGTPGIMFSINVIFNVQQTIPNILLYILNNECYKL